MWDEETEISHVQRLKGGAALAELPQKAALAEERADALEHADRIYRQWQETGEPNLIPGILDAARLAGVTNAGARYDDLPEEVLKQKARERAGEVFEQLQSADDDDVDSLTAELADVLEQAGMGAPDDVYDDYEEVVHKARRRVVMARYNANKEGGHGMGDDMPGRVRPGREERDFPKFQGDNE